MKTSIAVFDIDGTLTDSVALHQAAFAEALQTFGFPALEMDWPNYQHHSDSAIFLEGNRNDRSQILSGDDCAARG